MGELGTSVKEDYRKIVYDSLVSLDVTKILSAGGDIKDYADACDPLSKGDSESSKSEDDSILNYVLTKAVTVLMDLQNQRGPAEAILNCRKDLAICKIGFQIDDNNEQYVEKVGNINDKINDTTLNDEQKEALYNQIFEGISERQYVPREASESSTPKSKFFALVSSAVSSAGDKCKNVYNNKKISLKEKYESTKRATGTALNITLNRIKTSGQSLIERLQPSDKDKGSDKKGSKQPVAGTSQITEQLEKDQTNYSNRSPYSKIKRAGLYVAVGVGVTAL